MTKKLLDDSITVSFKNNQLDDKVIMDVASKLNRKELKAYIRRLKTELLKRSVTVVTPHAIPANLRELFSKTYSDKILRFETDPGILLGVKVIHGDIVYDQSLKNEFTQITQNITD